ncbi:MAG: hypothetical protein ACE5QW_04060 [Thermoplasmata archaeon]
MRTELEKLETVDLLNMLRKRGYWIVKATDEIIATRPIYKTRYPRFHLRIFKEEKGGPRVLEIHIDWERPKHSKFWGKCSTAEGETIKKEMELLGEEFRSLSALSER